MHIEEINLSEKLNFSKKILGKNFKFLLSNEKDNQGIHLAIFDNHKIKAIFSIFINNRIIEFTPIIIHPENQLKGYGTAIIKWLINYYEEMQFDNLISKIPKESLGFYISKGFIEKEENKSNKNIIEIAIK